MSRASTNPPSVKAGDGRVLEVEVTGDREGAPVFLLHGTPGSRNGPKPRDSVLYRLGVRLICYSRPGYGGSDRNPDRTVADAAADVEAIANELEIERFAVVGRSGGGPHALACSALLGAKVARTLVLVSLAPADASELDWYSGMAKDNLDEYSSADADPSMLTEHLRLRTDQILDDPESLVRRLRTQMLAGDRRVVDDVAFRRLLAETYTDALRNGPDGWIDDVLAFRKYWGFSLKEIGGPVRFWHGADDTFSPVTHSRWLADQIPGASIEVQRGAAHFGAMEVLPEMLPWLTEWHGVLVGTPGPGHVTETGLTTAT